MGIETAIIGSAILGGVGSVVGASRTASATRDATRAQTAAANQNLALQRDIYNDQRGLFQPYYQAGLQGLYGPSGVMDLMGMGGNPSMNAFASGNYGTQTAFGSSMGGGSQWDGYLQANPDVMQHYQTLTPQQRSQFPTPQAFAEYHYNTTGRAEGRPTGPAQPGQVAGQPAGDPGKAEVNGGVRSGTEGSMPGVDPRTQALRNTPGYQFQMDEARRGVENSFAGRGKLLSGGAMTALQDRSQGIADNTYQQTLNNAFNLTNIGMGSAAQIGGAGQNYAAGAGNAYTNIGNAQANGAMGQANAFNQGMQGLYNSAMSGIGAYGGMTGWGGAGAAATAPAGTFNGISANAFRTAMPSDARVKTDVEHIGQRNGHDWYRFRYVWDPGTAHEGVMAQEVMQTRPDAVVADPRTGILLVNYDALGLEMV